LFTAQQIKTDLQLEHATDAEDIQTYDETETNTALATENALKNSKLSSEQQLEDEKATGTITTNSNLVDAASIEKVMHSATSRSSKSSIYATSQIAQAISRG